MCCPHPQWRGENRLKMASERLDEAAWAGPGELQQHVVQAAASRRCLCARLKAVPQACYGAGAIVRLTVV